MAWIEVHQALRDHRKVWALAGELEMQEAHVSGHLIYLWLWAIDNAPEGYLPASKHVIERAAGWAGKPGEFVRALVAVGFVDESEDGLRLHDWDIYTGRLIDKRKADAERKRRERTSDSRPLDIQRTSDGRRADGARTAHVPTLPTEQNHTETHASPPDNITPFKPAAQEAAPEAASAAPVPAAAAADAKPPAPKRAPKYSGDEQAYVSALLKGVKEQTGIKGALPTEGKERDAAHWFYRAHDGEPAPVTDVLDCYRVTKAQTFWQGKFLSLQKLEACYAEYRRDPAAYKTPRASPSAQRNGHAPPPPLARGMDATQVPSPFQPRASPTPPAATA